MEVDFLLIGQGIAGTALAHRLISSGNSVMLYDLPLENKSSSVAAGLYNPITGKKMVKTWLADLLFPEIEPFYEELEELLKCKLLYKKPIYRPFLSIEEQNEWMGYSGEPSLQPYFEKILISPLHKEVFNPYGGILLRQSGYLDIKTLLGKYTTYLKEKGALKQEKFNEAQIIFGNERIIYRDIKAKGLVYCNGLGALSSKFFKNLPFAPVKGEILDLDQHFHPTEVINRGVFRIPLPSGAVRVGSTYSWHDLETGPTERAKIEILDKLGKLIKPPVNKVIAHNYGIRPATRDRRPFLGKHPELDRVYIFNGFGAKGVSLVPYFSKEMLELLLNGKEPQKEVNIIRCNRT